MVRKTAHLIVQAIAMKIYLLNYKLAMLKIESIVLSLQTKNK